MITPTPQLLGAPPTYAQLLAYQAPSTPLPLSDTWSSQGAATSPLTFGTVPTALVPNTLQQPLFTTPTSTVNPLASTFNTSPSFTQPWGLQQALPTNPVVATPTTFNGLPQTLPPSIQPRLAMPNTPFDPLAPLPVVNPQVLAASTSTPSTLSTAPANNPSNPLANVSQEQINAAAKQLGIDPRNVPVLGNTNVSNSTSTPRQESTEVASLPINQATPPTTKDPTSPRSESTSGNSQAITTITNAIATVAQMSASEINDVNREKILRKLNETLALVPNGSKPTTVAARQEDDTTPGAVSDNPPTEGNNATSSTPSTELDKEITTGGLSAEDQKIINKPDAQITKQDGVKLKGTVKRLSNKVKQQAQTIKTLQAENKDLKAKLAKK